MVMRLVKEKDQPRRENTNLGGKNDDRLTSAS